MKSVDEVSDKIAPLPSTRDQAMALAQYVSNQVTLALCECNMIAIHTDLLYWCEWQTNISSFSFVCL